LGSIKILGFIEFLIIFLKMEVIMARLKKVLFFGLLLSGVLFSEGIHSAECPEVAKEFPEALAAAGMQAAGAKASGDMDCIMQQSIQASLGAESMGVFLEHDVNFEQLFSLVYRIMNKQVLVGLSGAISFCICPNVTMNGRMEFIFRTVVYFLQNFEKDRDLVLDFFGGGGLLNETAIWLALHFVGYNSIQVCVIDTNRSVNDYPGQDGRSFYKDMFGDPNIKPVEMSRFVRSIVAIPGVDGTYIKTPLLFDCFSSSVGNCRVFDSLLRDVSSGCRVDPKEFSSKEHSGCLNCFYSTDGMSYSSFSQGKKWGQGCCVNLKTATHVFFAIDCSQHMDSDFCSCIGNINLWGRQFEMRLAILGKRDRYCFGQVPSWEEIDPDEVRRSNRCMLTGICSNKIKEKTMAIRQVLPAL
jgi:hypothetical protein